VVHVVGRAGESRCLAELDGATAAITASGTKS